jgi:hypothetical protein
VKPAGCTLTAEGAVLQRDRIAALRPSVRGVGRSAGEVRIELDPTADGEVLASWAATERECCSFLTIDYDEQMLRIASDEPGREDLLDGFAAVFAAPDHGIER